MASGGKYLNKGGSGNPQKKSAVRWAKPVLIAVFVVLILIITVVVILINRYKPTPPDPTPPPGPAITVPVFPDDDPAEETTEETQPPTTQSVPQGKGVVNILVIGQDAREGESSKNSDTVILCSLNKETKVLTLTSFLRNSYIRLSDFTLSGYQKHTCGKSLLTFAYALGYSWGGDVGAFYMIDQTLINNYGAAIDHNIEINLDCFIEIMKAVGPIEVEMDADEAAYMNSIMKIYNYDRTFEEGVNALYPESALIYARMRHATPGDSDMNRTRRQRTVITQVLNKIKHLSISEMDALVKSVLPYIISDIGTAELGKYIIELVPYLPFLQVESVQIPMEGTYHGDMIDIFKDGGSHSSLIVDNLQKNRLMVEAICTGTERPE